MVMGRLQELLSELIKDAKYGQVICDQVPEGENHTLLARREELNATMMEQGCTRDMDKWGTVWSQVNRQIKKLRLGTRAPGWQS